MAVANLLCKGGEELTVKETIEGNSGDISYSVTFKVVFLGDPSVGKTCLAKLYINRNVQEETVPTIGFDIQTKDVTVNGVLCRLQIWDTAGMEKFRNGLISHYYKNIDSAIFVYDITCRESFANVDQWLKEMRQYGQPNNEPIITFLIGNQNDRKDERAVSTDEGKLYADQHGMIFTELSAKDKKNLKKLDNIFVQLSEHMLAARSAIVDDWVIINEVPAGPIPKYADNARQRCKC